MLAALLNDYLQTPSDENLHKFAKYLADNNFEGKGASKRIRAAITVAHPMLDRDAVMDKARTFWDSVKVTKVYASTREDRAEAMVRAMLAGK